MAENVKTKPPGTLWTGPSADGPFARRAGGETSRERSAVTLTSAPPAEWACLAAEYLKNHEVRYRTTVTTVPALGNF